MGAAGRGPLGNLWAAVLAAGTSSRLGAPKPLVLLDDEPLLVRSLRQALAVPEYVRVVAVLGHQARQVAAALAGSGLGGERLLVLVNPDYRRGLGTSVARAARAALAGGAEALVLAPCDLPFLDAAAHRRVVEAWARARAEGRPVLAVRSTAAGRPAHPVLLARPLLERAARLTGDRGAGPLLEGLGAACVAVEQPDEAAQDLDTPEDLRLLAERRAVRVSLPGARTGGRPGSGTRRTPPRPGRPSRTDPR